MKAICKQCLCVLLTIAILASMTSFSLFSDAASIHSVPTDAFEGYYPDVKIAAWYYDAVSYVTYYEIMSGYRSGSFGPANNLQRQDFVLILSRVDGADLSPYQNATGGLSDVVAGSYYAPAVAWAIDKGIITGYQDGTFGVGDTITREQVCTIFYRYNNSPAVSNAADILSVFPDDVHISSFAFDAMAWAVQNGVISGMQNGKIAPVAGASRAQIATIAMRMGLTATNSPTTPRKPTVVSAYTRGSYAVPRIQLRIASEYVASINEIIWKNMYTDFTQKFINNNYDIYTTAGYHFALNDNILSLVAYTQVETSVTYYVYNINTVTGKAVSSQSVASVAGVAKKDYNAYTRRVMGSYYCNQYDSITPNTPIYEEYLQQYNATVASSNVAAAAYYLNEDNELCLIAKIYSLAGANYYWYDINTTEVTLRNNLP